MTCRGALLLVALVGGCSSGSAASMDLSATPMDLSAASTDMSSCTLSYSGAVSTTVLCRVFLCHPTGTTEYLDVAGPVDNPTEASAHFTAADGFAVRSYGAADLASYDAGIVIGGTRYELQPATGAALALTVDSLTEPPTDPCSGTAHGSAQLTLTEVVSDDAGQSNGPGRVTLNAMF